MHSCRKIKYQVYKIGMQRTTQYMHKVHKNTEMCAIIEIIELFLQLLAEHLV